LTRREFCLRRKAQNCFHFRLVSLLVSSAVEQQNGKEIKAYHVGIGRKNFPVPVDEREASALIFKPDWIPPDSAWMQRTKGVTPYERIAASEACNPHSSATSRSTHCRGRPFGKPIQCDQADEAL